MVGTGGVAVLTGVLGAIVGIEGVDGGVCGTCTTGLLTSTAGAFGVFNALIFFWSSSSKAVFGCSLRETTVGGRLFMRPRTAKISANTNKRMPIMTATTGTETPRACKEVTRFERNELAVLVEPVRWSNSDGEALGDMDGFGVLDEGEGETLGSGISSPFSPPRVLPVPLVMTPAVAAEHEKLLGFVAKRQVPW